MKFIKENSYDIVRLFINQVGITIFSWVLYTSITTFDKAIGDPLKIIISVFSTIFYLSLIYNVTWEYGSKDKISIDAGKITGSKYRGLFMGLCANSINFFLGIFGVAFCVLFMLSGVDAFYTIFVVFNFIMRFIEAMYLGMVQGIFSALPDESYVTFLVEAVALTIFPIISVLVAHFGYLLGYKDKKLFSLPKKNSK